MTIETRTMHLTEEELDDALLGDASVEATAHLDGCAACRAQLEPFHASMAAFNTGSMAWAQAKANTISRDLSGVRATGSRRPLMWGLGTAMVAVIAFVLATAPGRVGHPVETAGLASGPETTQHQASSAQDIAADNAMLNAIDSEINTTVPSPVAEYRPVHSKAEGHAVREVRE